MGACIPRKLALPGRVRVDRQRTTFCSSCHNVEEQATEQGIAVDEQEAEMVTRRKLTIDRFLSGSRSSAQPQQTCPKDCTPPHLPPCSRQKKKERVDDPPHRMAKPGHEETRRPSTKDAVGQIADDVIQLFPNDPAA
nr:hypothetical protein CFP56_26649 [Quercus suber]